MIDKALQQEYYEALVQKKSEYEGIFFVGVKTTGVFCRPTCPAKKPKFENCEFFSTAQEALLASYRPCKRCHPFAHPHPVSKLIEILIEAVEKNPEKKWKDQDFKALSVDVSTARRHFKKRFGMTFVQYARARRMGLALKQIRTGETVIDTQLSTGYESGSRFRDAFTRILGAPPTKLGQASILNASWVDTPLGPMIAVANDEALFLLEFVDRRGLEKEIERLRIRTKSAIIPGCTKPIILVKKELNEYFEGSLKEFHTPLFFLGSPFQKKVWEYLQKIPYGSSISYLEIAKLIGNPKACRAVAQANGANQLAIVIPCHRVINTNGALGGYGGGVARKKWFLDHEKSHA